MTASVLDSSAYIAKMVKRINARRFPIMSNDKDNEIENEPSNFTNSSYEDYEELGSAVDNMDNQPTLIPIVPLYKIQLDTDQDPAVSFASVKAEKGESLDLSCYLKGTYLKSGKLEFNFNDNEIINDEFRSIEWNDQVSSVTVHITNLQESHIGNYDCSLTSNSNEAQVPKIRLHLDMKLPTISVSMSDQTPCGAHWAGYCQNGGSCFKDLTLKEKGCRCPPGFEGVKCESASTGPIKNLPPATTQAPLPESCLTPEKSMKSEFVGVTVGAIFILIVLGIIIYVQRKRHNKSYLKLQEIILSRDNNEQPEDNGQVTRLLNASELAFVCPLCKEQLQMIQIIDKTGEETYKVVPSPNFKKQNLMYTRSSSLPPSTTTGSVSSYNQAGGGGMLPFDPQCSQCQLEWKHLRYPEHAGPGVHYFPAMPHTPHIVDSATVIQGIKRERRFGVSVDDRPICTVEPEDIDRGGEFIEAESSNEHKMDDKKGSKQVHFQEKQPRQGISTDEPWIIRHSHPEDSTHTPIVRTHYSIKDATVSAIPSKEDDDDTDTESSALIAKV